MAYSECLPTRLNPLAERTCFSQAQHLQGIGEELVQPLAPSGSALPAGGWHTGTSSYIATWDWHDSNRVNNQNGLPVVLEFDKYV